MKPILFLISMNYINAFFASVIDCHESKKAMMRSKSMRLNFRRRNYLRFSYFLARFSTFQFVWHFILGSWFDIKIETTIAAKIAPIKVLQGYISSYQSREILNPEKCPFNPSFQFQLISNRGLFFEGLKKGIKLPPKCISNVESDCFWMGWILRTNKRIEG